MMKKAKLVIFIMLLAFFVQGCDPIRKRAFYLTPAGKYKPISSSTAFKMDIGKTIQIIKCLASKEGFREYDLPSEFEIKYYTTDYKAGTQSIYINYFEDRDVIGVSVVEMPSFKFSQDSNDIYEELAKRFRVQFGTYRIKEDSYK